MIEGYVDLRNELCEILGGDVTDDDLDAAVDALVNEERTTATAALGELNALAQTPSGKQQLRGMLADWIEHERAMKKDGTANRCAEALNHLLAAMDAERRGGTGTAEVERRH
jgi:hypothetical protein